MLVYQVEDATSPLLMGRLTRAAVALRCVGAGAGGGDAGAVAAALTGVGKMYMKAALEQEDAVALVSLCHIVDSLSGLKTYRHEAF